MPTTVSGTRFVSKNKNAAGRIIANGVLLNTNKLGLRRHFPPVFADVTEDKVGAAIFLQVPEILNTELSALGGKLFMGVRDFFGGSHFQRKAVRCGQIVTVGRR